MYLLHIWQFLQSAIYGATTILFHNALTATQRMSKLNHLMILLIAASILTAHQMVGTSWMLIHKPGEDPSRFVDQPDTSVDDQRRHRQDAKERRHARLIEPPTNIYVLGERNSGTTFTAKGLISPSFILHLWITSSGVDLFLISRSFHSCFTLYALVSSQTSI